MQLNFYEIMGISPDFPQERIAQAFRMRAKQVHPDKCKQQQQNATNKQATILLLQAYRVLNNPLLRRQYDIQLQSQLKTSQLNIHRYFEHTNIIRKGERMYVQCQQCAGDTEISEKDLLTIAQRDKHECFVKCWHCGLSLAVQIE